MTLANTTSVTLVEELFFQPDFAPYPLVKGIQLKIAQAIVEVIAATDLGGPLVVNARNDLRPIREKDRGHKGRSKPVVALTIDLLVELKGADRAERSVLVGRSHAIGIAEGTVGATIAADVSINRTSGAREVAAAAAG